MRKYLRHLRWALPYLVVAGPLTWATYYRPLDPKTWAQAVLCVTESMLTGFAASAAVGLSAAWAMGVLDRKAKR